MSKATSEAPSSAATSLRGRGWVDTAPGRRLREIPRALLRRARSGSAAPEVDAPRVDEVAFPVDLVYTWVDGDDPEWAAAKDQVLRELDINGRAADAHHPARYRSHDELRYSLRSVAQHADFVRHVFVVTAGQVPEWLNVDHERLTVVDHRDIFPSRAHLPTFNSHAIESCLHHIEGLAEHYLYMNDDFFFARAVAPEQFFHANGMTKFFLSHAVVGDGDPSRATRSVDAAAANTRRVIHERFGRLVTRKIKHAPYPQRRSVLYEMEAALADLFERTAASRIRGAEDVAVPSSLFHYYAFLTGRAVPGRITSRYVALDEKRLARRLRRLRRRDDFDVVCVNDSLVGDGADRQRRSARLAQFMDSRWSTKGPFER